MKMDYTFFYVEANAVCIIMFALLLFRSLVNVDHQEKQRFFAGILLSHILYFFSDIAWALSMGEYIPHTYLSCACINVLNSVILNSMTCLWFIYIELAQGAGYIIEMKKRAIVRLPAILGSSAMIILFLLFPEWMMDSEHNMTQVYYLLFLTIPFIYVLSAAARSIPRALQKENFAFKRQYLVCGIYPVVISLFGIVQTLAFDAPFFCFSCMILMTYVYIISLNDQVSLDDLTRLNNRTQLKKYVVSESSKQGEKKTHYILMIDLNKFKIINDQFGHVEGDNALRRTADALRHACGANPLRTFIARFGGDEFIVIAKTDDEEKVRELICSIKETLIRLNKEAGVKYELSASIGYASYSGDLNDFPEALSQADASLYKEKEARKKVL